MNKVCSVYEDPFKRNHDPRIIFSSCEETIEALTEEEKKNICEKPSFFFRKVSSERNFDKTLQTIQPVCDKFFSVEEKYELQETLNLINASNVANLTTVPLDKVNPFNISASHMSSSLAVDKLEFLSSRPFSFKSTNLDTSNNTVNAVDSRAGIVVAAGACLFGLAGLGYCLFKSLRKPSKTITSNNDECGLLLNTLDATRSVCSA